MQNRSASRSVESRTSSSCAISVVLITRNRASELRSTLQRLIALPEQPPIIVVDNASWDDTRHVVQQAGPSVSSVRLEHNAGSAGRNVGVQKARTPYVAFSDDDSWWAPGALTDAVRLFQGYPRLGLLAARILVGVADRLDPTCREMAQSPLLRMPDLPGPSVLGFIACGAIIRKRAFLQAGGFHRRLGVGGEEDLLAIDLACLGWGLAYCSDVIAHHHPAGGCRPARQSRLMRNALWTAWLRYRGPEAIRLTMRMLVHAARDSSTRAGVSAAVRGLLWILKERSPAEASIQTQLNRLRRES